MRISVKILAILQIVFALSFANYSKVLANDLLYSFSEVAIFEEKNSFHASLAFCIHDNSEDYPFDSNGKSEDDDEKRGEKEEKDSEEEVKPSTKKKKIKFQHFSLYSFLPVPSLEVVQYFDFKKIDAFTYLFKAFLISKLLYSPPIYLLHCVMRC